MGQDRVGPSRHRPIAHGWRPRTPWKTKEAPEGSLREAGGAWCDLAHHAELVEGKEVPEAQRTRNGEGAIAISPSRTRSKEHLAPHFVTDSRLDPHSCQEKGCEGLSLSRTELSDMLRQLKT